MATDGTTEESATEQPAEPGKEVPSLDERAQRGADLVESGLAELKDLSAHEAADRSDDAIREAVEAELARRQDNDASVVQEGDDDPEGTITSADGVDWPALWAEFGFDSPDAAGNRATNRLKVAEALRVTDQPVTGDPEGLIDAAVDLGHLREVEVTNSHGEVLSRRYLLGELYA